jgi:hypothetical protein
LIVCPDGKTEAWKPGGPIEQKIHSDSRIIIWGSFFPGEELTEIIKDPDRKEEALNALRFWLKARIALEENFESEEPLLAGTLIVTKPAEEPQFPFGTVFFPPARLAQYALELWSGSGILVDYHYLNHIEHGLEGPEAVSFSAGVMLYGIFCGAPPFPESSPGNLRRDIREGNYLPPRLAAPGLDPKMTELIDGALCPRQNKGHEPSARPSPEEILDFLEAHSSKMVSAWIRQLTDDERTKIENEREQFIKKKTVRIKMRDFFSRNAKAIAISLSVILALALFTRGFLRRNAEKPNTIGMNPVEVAEAYYGAFNNLDHQWMEACVSGKAGRDDIMTATNFFVISKVREAYEKTSAGIFMPAGEWLEAGSPDTDSLVFGVTDLKIIVLSSDEKNANIEANYTLWLPAPGDEDTPSAGEAIAQDKIVRDRFVQDSLVQDSLVLSFKKARWIITDIKRAISPQAID